MIAVDTSALVAILFDEKNAKRLRARLAVEDSALLSAGSALELQLVLAGTGNHDAWGDVEAVLSSYNIKIHPFDETQLAFARDAALQFGKGRHKAKLNYGDCFAYALARSEGIPLLYVGNDFVATDITAA